MLRKRPVISCAVLLLACTGGAYAQDQIDTHEQINTHTHTPAAHALAEGTVEVESEDHTRRPVPEAVVEVYGEDRGGHWSVTTDKKGHYKLSLPNTGSYLMIVSGQGLMPTWDHICPSCTLLVNFVTYPGIGNRLSSIQVQQLRAKGSSRQVPMIVSDGIHSTVTALSEQERPAYFRSLRDHAEAVKTVRDLKAESDDARDSYDSAVRLKVGGEFQRSLDEFGKLLAAYGESTDEYFAKLARYCLANMAEAHYLWAVDLYSKGYVDQAKEHFVSAIDLGRRYVDRVSGLSTVDPESQSFVLISDKIIADSSLDLVKFMQLVEFKKTALEAADRAAAMDAAHASGWTLLKARTLTAAGEREAAIAGYKAVLSLDQKNTDALYELSLVLLKSESQQDLQDAKGYLKRFITLVLDTDDRLEPAKQAVQSLESVPR
jgi:tetratricopeptide (TPR) repeat protein